VRAPARPVFANSTAAPYPGSPDEIRATLASQIARPVRFVDEIEAIYAAGARIFVEAGPGSVLTGLVGKIDAQVKCVNVQRPGGEHAAAEGGAK
jgi:malonyl CoA-acyl carrier protein transacylase